MHLRLIILSYLNYLSSFYFKSRIATRSRLVDAPTNIRKSRRELRMQGHETTNSA